MFEKYISDRKAIFLNKRGDFSTKFLPNDLINDKLEYRERTLWLEIYWTEIDKEFSNQLNLLNWLDEAHKGRITYSLVEIDALFAQFDALFKEKDDYLKTYLSAYIKQGFDTDSIEDELRKLQSELNKREEDFCLDLLGKDFGNANTYTFVFRFLLGDAKVGFNLSLDERTRRFKLCREVLDKRKVQNNAFQNVKAFLDYRKSLVERYNELLAHEYGLVEAYKTNEIAKMYNGNAMKESKGKIEALASIAQDTLSCIENDGDQDVIRKEIQKLLEQEFQIAIIAPMSSGKSTVINALLGADILPTAHEATTGVITTIKHLSDETITPYAELKKNEQSVHLSPVKAEIRKKEDEGKELYYPLREHINEESLKVTVYAPIPFVKSNLFLKNTRLIDTPGVGAVAEEHDRITFNYIKSDEVNVVLYVVDVTKWNMSTDAQILARLKEVVPQDRLSEKMIFILNKIDNVNVQDRSSAIDNIRKGIEEYIPKIGKDQIIPFIAKSALFFRVYKKNDGYYSKELDTFRKLPSEMIQELIEEEQYDEVKNIISEADAKAIQESGIQNLESVIVNFLRKNKTNILINDFLRSITHIIDKQIRLFENNVKAYEVDIDKLRKNQERFQEYKKIFEKKVKDAKEAVNKEKKNIEKFLEDNFADLQKLAIEDVNEIMRRHQDQSTLGEQLRRCLSKIFANFMSKIPEQSGIQVNESIRKFVDTVNKEANEVYEKVRNDFSQNVDNKTLEVSEALVFAEHKNINVHDLVRKAIANAHENRTVEQKTGSLSKPKTIIESIFNRSTFKEIMENSIKGAVSNAKVLAHKNSKDMYEVMSNYDKKINEDVAVLGNLLRDVERKRSQKTQNEGKQISEAKLKIEHLKQSKNKLETFGRK